MPEQPGLAVWGDGPERRGRAALRASAGDPRGGPWPGAPRCRPEPQQPGLAVQGDRPFHRGRAAIPGGAGDLRGEPGPGSSQHQDRARQSGRPEGGSRPPRRPGEAVAPAQGEPGTRGPGLRLHAEADCQPAGGMPLQPLQGHDRRLYPGAIGIGETN